MNIVPPPPAGPRGLPPPIAAAGVATPPLIQGTLMPPNTFAELYNLPTADAHAGVYGPVLALFVMEAHVLHAS